MVALTRSMEFVTTGTEAQALLLESNLIKRLKPRFNVVLRDDKSFAEILLRRDHPAPQVRKHRGAHTIQGDYFGPFASTWAVNRTVNILQKAFLLRSCSDSVYDSRTRPVHAAPDQALLGALHRPDHPGGLRRPRRRGAPVPVRQVARGAGAPVRRHDRRGRGHGVRARRQAARPHPRALGDQHGAVDQPAERGRGRRLRPARGGRPGVRPGLLLPRPPELGQPRVLPAV